MLLGFVSAVGIQLLGRAFGPFDPWELVYYPLLGVAGGWLGAVLSRGALARQEALYRATDALFSADSPRDVAVSVGRNLAGPSQERVSLWRISPDAGNNGDLGLDALGSWAPGAAKAWPEGRRLDARRLPAISDLRRWSYRIVKDGDLPPGEREVWEGSGIRSALLVPLGDSGGADGLLVVSSRG